MKRILRLLAGSPGHPSHPPLTDVTIGAFTLGTVLAVLGWFGVAEERTAVGAFAAVCVGLLSAGLSILTGFLDYLRIRRGTPLRRTAAVHWVATVSSTGIFIAAAALLQRGYDTGDIGTVAVGTTVAAWLVLLFGGWVGGAVVFVHGMRVTMEPGTPTAEALRPTSSHRSQA